MAVNALILTALLVTAASFGSLVDISLFSQKGREVQLKADIRANELDKDAIASESASVVSMRVGDRSIFMSRKMFRFLHGLESRIPVRTIPEDLGGWNFASPAEVDWKEQSKVTAPMRSQGCSLEQLGVCKFAGYEYLPQFNILLKEAPNAAVLDVGAAEGLLTLAALAHGHRPVVSVEALPTLAASLASDILSLELKWLKSRHIFGAAWNTTGERIHIDPNAYGESGRIVLSGQVRSPRDGSFKKAKNIVGSIALNDLQPPPEHIILASFSVSGCELLAMQGASEWLKRSTYVISEFSPLNIRGVTGADPVQMFEMMEKLNFDAFILDCSLWEDVREVLLFPGYSFGCSDPLDLLEALSDDSDFATRTLQRKKISLHFARRFTTVVEKMNKALRLLFVDRNRYSFSRMTLLQQMQASHDASMTKLEAEYRTTEIAEEKKLKKQEKNKKSKAKKSLAD